MKNKKNIRFIIPLFFLFSLCFYALCQTDSQPEKETVLDKLKDPKQYVEKNNEKQEKDGSLEKKDTSSQTNSWFLQHQNVWGTGQMTVNGEGGENAASETTDTKGTSWIYYFFRMVIALIFVVGLILVLLGGLRYFSQRTYQGIKSIGKIVGVLYLSPRTRIYYVQSAGKVFMLGLSGDQMSLLFTFPEDEFFAVVASEDVTDSVPSPKTFSKVLEDVETRIHSHATSGDSEIAENIDDEIVSLKANIQRLQQEIREEKHNALDQ